MIANQEVSAEQLAKIRGLADFDLIMLVSEIHDHGWQVAADTLNSMPVGTASQLSTTPSDSKSISKVTK